MPIVEVPPIRDLGTVPNNNMDEATFNVTAENFTTQMAPWGGDVKAVADSAKTNAEYSNQRANDSNTSAETAAARLIDVQTAANGAFAAANYKGEWSTLTGALNVPATVTHLGRLWYLKLNLANVTTQAPALGSTYWGEVSRNDFTVFPCPAGTTIAADRGMYRMSSGSSVLQLPASPFHGMVVAAVNVSGTLSPYIQRNGKTICGDAEDYVMNVLNWQIMLQFDSASNDWVRINGVTAYTAAQPAIASANTWTAPQNFTGGLSVGDGKMFLRKTVNVAAPAYSASTVTSSSSPHGIAITKIKAVSAATVSSGGSLIIPPEFGLNPASRYSVYLDGSTCVVSLAANQGQDISGKTVAFVIEYEA